MRKVAFALLLILGLNVFAWPALGAEGYSEKLEQNYTVYWDGSADIKFVTTYYGPSEIVNKTKESMLKMGLENATTMLVQQQVQVLSQLGLTLVNASGEILGYNDTGPLVLIVTGKILDFAKYYSYDNVWEIELDLLRVNALSQIDPTKFNESFDFDNYYVIALPEGAKITKLPPDYRQESQGSYVFIDVNATDNTVRIHSRVHLSENVTMEDLNRIYGSPQAFLIQYTGREGAEGNYTTWLLNVYNNLTVKDESSTLDTLEEYIEPESYINYLKFQIMMQGEASMVQSVYQSYERAFTQQGVEVKDWNITLENVNSTGPLRLRLHWVLANYTKYSNGEYIYTYDPTLGLNAIPTLNRINAAINQTVTTRITLPKGSKFTQIPDDIALEANGSKVLMKVEKVSDNEIVIKSHVFIRYGMKKEDYSALMSKVPTQLEFKYTLPEKGSEGICGPALITGLVLIPLVLYRRRR
ncbi:MAG: CGP-CTERM sorting domain-containing protein [Thermococcus sp.]|nr:CGP-CTERM sorting domain-containing protein [Thermococcus sp.]